MLVPGKLSTNTADAYVVDTDHDPGNESLQLMDPLQRARLLLRRTRAAVCSVSGDVWLLEQH